MYNKFINVKLIIHGIFAATSLCIPLNKCYANLQEATQGKQTKSIIPYIGFESGRQYFGFKSGYGDNVFVKEIPKINIFAGLKLNDYFGIEGGYETTGSGTRIANIGYKDMYLGKPYPIGLNSGEIAEYFTKVQIYGWYLGLNAEYPLNDTYPDNYWSLVSYGGIKNTKVKLTSSLFLYAGHLPNINVTNVLKQSNSKILLKLSAGLQYSPFENLSFRFMLSFENTSALKPHNDSDNFFEARLKNSISYGLGIVLKK